jgi:hypothetical protein
VGGADAAELERRLRDSDDKVALVREAGREGLGLRGGDKRAHGSRDGSIGNGAGNSVGVAIYLRRKLRLHFFFLFTWSVANGLSDCRTSRAEPCIGCV